MNTTQEKKFQDTLLQPLKNLIGKKITLVRWMGDDETEGMAWGRKPCVIQFEDGTILIPMSDDEGNDGGALYVQSADEKFEPETIGTL